MHANHHQPGVQSPADAHASERRAARTQTNAHLAVAFGTVMLVAGFLGGVLLSQLFIEPKPLVMVAGLLVAALAIPAYVVSDRWHNEARRLLPLRHGTLCNIAETAPFCFALGVRIEGPRVVLAEERMGVTRGPLIEKGAPVALRLDLPLEGNLATIDWDETERLQRQLAPEPEPAPQPVQGRVAIAAPSCVSCGATLEPSPYASSIRCPYCRTPNQIIAREPAS